jgi:hypothetical protein
LRSGQLMSQVSCVRILQQVADPVREKRRHEGPRPC